MVVRPYTPITLDTQKGYVDFVIKVSLHIVGQSHTSAISSVHNCFVCFALYLSDGHPVFTDQFWRQS